MEPRGRLRVPVIGDLGELRVGTLTFPKNVKRGSRAASSNLCVQFYNTEYIVYAALLRIHFGREEEISNKCKLLDWQVIYSSAVLYLPLPQDGRAQLRILRDHMGPISGHRRGSLG